VIKETRAMSATVPVNIEKANIILRLRNRRAVSPNNGSKTPPSSIDPPPIPKNPVLKEIMLETRDVKNIATTRPPSVETLLRVAIDEDSTIPVQC
jgi:hypothetical protein